MAGAFPPFEFTLSDAARREHSEGELLDPGARGTSLDLTAFVSCYNEAAYIVQTLEDIRLALDGLGISFEIIVVDDCSSDNSVELVKRYVAEHPNARIILRRNFVNRGLAQNYIDAAFLGRGRYYKLFCGDNTEPRESIARICSLLDRADMIIPRYVSVEGKGGFRKWLSAAYTGLVNLASGNRLSYYNGLAVHLRYNIMRWHPNTRGFGFQADILCMLLDQGATHMEVEVDAINRAASRALTAKNVLSVGHTLLDIVIRRVAKFVYRR